MVFKAACIQLNSNDQLDRNLASIKSMVIEAASSGASMIMLPENMAFLGEHGTSYTEQHYHEEEHPAIQLLTSLAKQTGTYLLLGSVAITEAGDDKPFNRSYIIDPTGKIIARYNKIHLFDVSLPDKEPYEESRYIRRGEAATIVQTEYGTGGLTICYDLRFPYLYRRIAQAGASWISVPAAFTYTTGKAHWHVLLRARAIENGCFIFAPAQCGTHPGGRRTYGHSLMIDPWGRIIAEASEDTPEIIYADIDLTMVDDVRKSIPALLHDREVML